MTTLKVLGRVEPAAYQLNFDFVPDVNFKITQADILLSCRIEILRSDITVTCRVNRWGDDVLPWVLNYVYDFVNAEIDLIVFSSGKSFSVHLDKVVYPDGTSSLFVPEAPGLASLATACVTTAQDNSFRVELKEAFQIVCTNPPLMLALRDLCAAIKYGNNTLANCGRAVEGMRKALWGGDESNQTEERAAWEKMRAKLNLSKDYLQSITDPSRQPRHGSAAFISPEAKKDALTKSWTVMNRLIIFYRNGGDTPLPLDSYPQLTA